MLEPPVEVERDRLRFAQGSVVFAGHWLHEDRHPAHTHSFVEIAVMTGGAGVHHCRAGRRRLGVGDVVLIRPGVWHAYEECRALDMYNCCFAAELLQHELAWTREDPLLGYLLWAGPYAQQRRGYLGTHLGPDQLDECIEHLDALAALAAAPIGSHRGDVVGRLALFLSGVARAATAEAPAVGAPSHPSVLDAMRMMESRPEHQWSLTELAAELHLAPGYLVRLFKNATGLPPMAFLARHRVEVAASRLLRSDDPINRIGESVGWADQNYFARRFKAHYGMSASAYRARFSQRAVGLQKLANRGYSY